MEWIWQAFNFFPPLFMHVTYILLNTCVMKSIVGWIPLRKCVCLSSLCHYTLIFSLIYLKKQMSVWKSLLCHIRVLFDILPSFFTLIEKRCIIKKYGPYFLFIYADSTVLAVPVDLLFCSPTSSCSNWADQCRIKRFLKSLDVASVDECYCAWLCWHTGQVQR